MICEIELLGVWTCCEDHLHKTSASLKASAISADECVQQAAAKVSGVGMAAAGMLRALMPQLMKIFSHSDMDVSSTVIDAINKLIALLKSQNTHLDDLRKTEKVISGIFIAEEYLGILLSTIYQQMQFPPEFAFDADDEDDAVVIEVKSPITCLLGLVCTRI